MSTKIFNGYRLPAMSSVELLAFGNQLRPQMQALKAQLITHFFTDNVIYHQDLYAATQDPALLPKTTLDYWQHLFDEQNLRARRGLRHGFFDFEASVVLFPQSHQTLALIYIYRPELKALWLQHTQAQDYHYQNQSDLAAGLTEAESQQRGRDWEQLLGEEAPNQRGLTYVYTTNEYFLETQDLRSKIVAAQPDFTTRLERLQKYLRERQILVPDLPSKLRAQYQIEDLKYNF